MSEPREAIAVVGMAGLFPGARNVEELWANLRAGIESVTFFAPEGRERWRPPDAPAFLVPAKGVIEGVETWDAGFFGFSRLEAQMMDPQQRLFLECAWTALEHAGYDSQQYPGKIGVFGGTSKRDYLYLLARGGFMEDPASSLHAQTGTEPDLLAPRTAFKLDLKGPSLNIQNGCASALAGVYLACESLRKGECDMALAGGASISAEQRTGGNYFPGCSLSPRGRCHTFDAGADGTVDSDGVGVVVLKRLSDALADGDLVRAVVLGGAMGNDGADRPGLLMPAAAGRARVVREALADAGVAAETVTYVETNGNGSLWADALEVAALTQAFRSGTDRRGFCGIGSIKTNIGHANSASGVIGLIKTVLALENGEIPASLHYERPNPEIDFSTSPFFVNDRLRSWETDGSPRRALVNAFGTGGFNAQVVLEEAPPPSFAGSESRPWQLLTLSAKTPTALETATANLAGHLERHPADIADIAWTLQTGRRAFEHRRTVLCQSVAEAIHALRTLDPGLVATGTVRRRDPPVAFLLSGGAAAAGGAGQSAGPYAGEPVFREEVERCCSCLRPQAGRRLRQVLSAGSGAPLDPLEDPALSDLALFALEYALGRLWMAWGLAPHTISGEGVGEYVAACLAGIAPLADTLALLAAQGVQPGRFAGALASSGGAGAPDRFVLEIGPAGDETEAYPLALLGRAWRHGVRVDWAGVHAGEKRRRLALPTYPFERQRYWVERILENEPFLERLSLMNAMAIEE